ncbi:MAG: ATP-binding protein [Limnothrix sp. CACIAM 69d]|nr:MAG: ATP-binding protein [Limnothrix sp. CACIAM 69d]
MAKIHKLANRTKERQTFLEMVRAEHDCRILLIEGESGMGKSTLLRSFRQECQMLESVSYVAFDCKGLESLPAFLYQFLEDLGKENFPRFTKRIRQMDVGGVEFTGNDISGQNQISIALNPGVDAKGQEYRQEQLIEDFVEDLLAMSRRVVIIVDTFQEAHEPFQQWIGGRWLKTVARKLTNVVMVVAGHHVPDRNNLAWGDDCEYFSLNGIRDHQEWCVYAQHVGLGHFAEETIRALAICFQGKPSEVSQALHLVNEEWSA